LDKKPRGKVMRSPKAIKFFNLETGSFYVPFLDGLKNIADTGGLLSLRKGRLVNLGLKPSLNSTFSCTRLRMGTIGLSK
jgi:hypothetical protein